MEIKKSTVEDLLVLGGAALVLCLVFKPSVAGVPIPSAPTLSEPTPSSPIVGFPKPDFIPLHPRERIPE